MSVIQMSDYSQRQGIKQGRFLEACDHCPAVHCDYGTHWPTCSQCAEQVCDSCAQPGTASVSDGGKPYCLCVRCASEVQ